METDCNDKAEGGLLEYLEAYKRGEQHVLVAKVMKCWTSGGYAFLSGYLMAQIESLIELFGSDLCLRAARAQDEAERKVKALTEKPVTRGNCDLADK